ncbi:MAG: DinB family protein [Acidobacteriota bacterium]
MTRPALEDAAPGQETYIDLVPEDDVLSAMERQSSVTQRILASIDAAKASYRYAPAKWSVKELVGHLADAERVMGYRALAVARGETRPLPAFDEDVYVRNAGFDAWTIGDLAEQYALVRRSTIVLLCNLPESAWERHGIANDHPVSVRAIAFGIVGHERHHLAILRERYAVS